MIRGTGSRNRKLEIAAVVTALLAWGGSCGDDSPTWDLVWEDEFDGPAGQLPDSTNWRFDVGVDWGNAQLEYDTDRAENVSLDGAGHLAITARKENYQGEDGEREYTSGRINTSGLFEQARGRFEARIKLPVGQGMWPAFWLLGNDISTAYWPACGEIDIMEYRGQAPSIVHGSLHGPGYSGGGALTSRYTLSGRSFDADFHVFTVDWERDRLTWYVDGKLYKVVIPDDLPAGTRWVFDHPFFVILNLAVGGNFVGPPNTATLFPQAMLVDWVRVYRSTS